MIDYIKGKIDSLTPASTVVEAYGVGYAMAISANTYTALQNIKKDEIAKLYVYEAFRQDAANTLYGFASKDERELFELLIGVSSIGGQTARSILSAFTPSELSSVIAHEDVKMLKAVKGIGPKAAQRIIVDLKDKVTAIGIQESVSVTSGSGAALNKEIVNEAIGALTILGFPPATSHKAVISILKEDSSLSVEQVIKKALKML